MKLTDEQKKAIEKEHSEWKDKVYGDKTLQERQDFGQFFTPPELTIKMIETFDNFDEDEVVFDPTCGAGNLLAGVLAAGLAKPTSIKGIEIDPAILKICQERLSKFGVPRDNLQEGNAETGKLKDGTDAYKWAKSGKKTHVHL